MDALYTKTFPLNTFPAPKYVVVLSRMDGQWLLSRHRARTTWESQGGHIEAGESTLDAARRELWEESGATDFDLTPVCDYWSGSREGSAVGVVFLSHIHALGPLPESEMAEVRLFPAMPENITYPWITPVLLTEANKLL